MGILSRMKTLRKGNQNVCLRFVCLMECGGNCVRGGSYLSKESALTSALRTEKPLYVNGKPLSAPDTGTRFVLGLPVATSSYTNST